MLIYAPAVLAEMARICERHGVLFIADEVMTGFGRTGTLFACEQAGIVARHPVPRQGPDRRRAAAGGDAVHARRFSTRIISHDRAQTFFHSSSYTANPIACAAARANLEIWHDEPVLRAHRGARRGQAEARLAPFAR